MQEFSGKPWKNWGPTRWKRLTGGSFPVSARPTLRAGKRFDSPSSLLAVLLGKVGTPHVRPALHVDESHGERLLAELFELLRPDELLHRVVPAARRQVLPHAQVEASRPAQVGKDRQHFLFRLPEAEH